MNYISLLIKHECAEKRAEKLEARVKELEAELERLKAQEPVAKFSKFCGVWHESTTGSKSDIPLYAEPRPAAAVPVKVVNLPVPYCVVCDYVYDAQELRDALDTAGVKWERAGAEVKS